MEVNIRKAKPTDWKIIQKLNHEVFIHDQKYDEFLDIHWPSSLSGIKYYKQATKNPSYCCLIAEVDNKPVGYLISKRKLFGYRKAKIAEIQNMGVSPRFRSQGIGTQLIQALRKWCQKKGFHRIYVNAYYHNQRAIKFYQNQNLKPLDISLEGQV